MLMWVTPNNLFTAKVKFENDWSDFYDHPFGSHSKVQQYHFKKDNSNLNVTLQYCLSTVDY